MCWYANDREAGNEFTRENFNFRGVMFKFASRTRNPKRENGVKILMMQANVICKQLRNMNKK